MNTNPIKNLTDEQLETALRAKKAEAETAQAALLGELRKRTLDHLNEPVSSKVYLFGQCLRIAFDREMEYLRDENHRYSRSSGDRFDLARAAMELFQAVCVSDPSLFPDLHAMKNGADQSWRELGDLYDEDDRRRR